MSIPETGPAVVIEPQRPVRSRVGAGAWIGIVLGFLGNLAFIALILLIFGNQQRISDQFVVWNYEPTAVIASHVERSTMTDEGKFLFYASRPSVVPEKQFDPICASLEEGEGILGCYLPDTRRIYLYDVTDDRLDGIEEVVASHEMLHAAWDRMPKEERDELEPLLEAEVSARADDEVLTETLEYYAKAEPGERANELHSIMGTQYGDLSPELEAHYEKYFVDRQAVVDLNTASQVVFNEQIAQGDAINAQMEALAASVDADYAAYNAGYDQLNADIDDFNYRADTGWFTSESQFYAERDALVQRGDDLDAAYVNIQARVDEYNALNEQLKALNAVIDDLNAHLNIDPPRTTDG